MEHTHERANLLPGFSGEAWHSWAPRLELAPRFHKQAADGQTRLAITADGPYPSHGAWRCEVADIEELAAYEIRAEYRTKQVDCDSTSVHMILTWMDGERNWLLREYVEECEAREGGTRASCRVVHSPAGAQSVTVELEFRRSAAGEVVWTRAELVPAATGPRRTIKLATTYISPYTMKRDRLDVNLQRILDTIEQAGVHRPDMVCLPESIFSFFSGREAAEAAQPIPGALTRAVGDKARQIRSYVVFNLYEREGPAVYNTSVLINRDGEIAGKYRKTHVPLYEAQSGVTPGERYPVFDTDIGRIGLLICWDQMFPEAARILRLQGAEIICISTAGEGRIQQVARAVDNSVYLVVAGINGSMVPGPDGTAIADPNGKPSRLIDPLGKVLCEIGPDDGVGCVEVDLKERFCEYWLSVGPANGVPGNLFVKERRPDLYRLLTNNR